ncbi:phospholipase D-like protein [Leeuwenhoekiella aestuarii]|uniref:Phospholipase D-like protein n=1 Tax=Leeuwenhoekiella aestuarii TaxID=2249426 RepID=A0A4Q0NNU8_9FLAO|nr:PLD nuclease N-terminal domain-containing protein [Leeuwenhoekiella aestuarii]RXG11728.1 phospholipase D-like protein [Leeuwenhoekiella aestuarii]RXG12783.1 phospholipase D-like protein [Leeuwenhoekiella aestuarii]
MFLGMVGPWQIMLILGLGLGIILPIIALVDIVRHEFKGNNKIIWVLIVIFFNIFGSILYFAMGRQQRIDTV